VHDRALEEEAHGKAVLLSSYSQLRKSLNSAALWMEYYKTSLGPEDYFPNVPPQDPTQKPPADRSFSQLRHLEDGKKNLFVRFPQEFATVTNALQDHTAWLAKASALNKTQMSLDHLFRLMWRTAVIAGKGMGSAPILVPDDGIFVPLKEKSPSPPTCFCRLPEVLSRPFFVLKTTFLILVVFLQTKPTPKNLVPMLACTLCHELFHVGCVGAPKKAPGTTEKCAPLLLLSVVVLFLISLFYHL